MKLSQYIDHTLLKQTATKDQIIQLCQEAIDYDFYAVCVNSCYVPFAKKQLKNTPVKLAAVVGFPLGAMNIETKIFEAQQAVKHGADEIDVVINIGLLKSCDYIYVRNEIEDGEYILNLQFASFENDASPSKPVLYKIEK